MKVIFGCQKIYLGEVDSTNNFAAQLVSDGLCQNGAIVLADYQTQGKGQRGNEWVSNKGENILMSIVYQPEQLKVSEQIKLNWGTSLAIISFLDDYGINAKVKWPNDILVENQKIGGILLENHLLNSIVNTSIIGIGVNVNQIDFYLPYVTSMRNEKKTTFCLKSLTLNLVDKLNYFLFCEFHWLKTEYESKLFLKNQNACFEDAKGIFVGKIIGINSDGTLILLKGEETKVYGIKEITFRIDL